MSVNEKSECKMKKIKGILMVGVFVLVLSFFSACTLGNPLPYVVQPSYHKFKSLCDLPTESKGEELYNKILAHFGLSLDTVDWEYLNKRMIKFVDTRDDKVVYRTVLRIKTLRIVTTLHFYTKEPVINKTNIIKMSFDKHTYWFPYTMSITERNYLDTLGIAWRQDAISCTDDFFRREREKGW